MINETKIDNVDMKILAELDMNSKIPTTTLAKKIRISREVIKYRLKRLVDLGIIKSFTTMINPAKFEFIIYKIYLKLQNLSTEKEKELINYLKKDKKVFWLAKTDGTFDLIAGLYVKNAIEFDTFISKFIGEFGKQLSSKHISNTVYSIPFRKKYLSTKEGKEEEIVWGGTPEKEEIDNLMIKILKLIAENSRMSIAEICETLKTTPKTVLSKIKYLEKRKVILGYRTILNLEKINKSNFKAIIYFQNISPEKEKKFREFCKSNPNIIYYIKTIGEWDVELDIEIKEHKEFNNLIKEIRFNFGNLIKRIDSIYISEEPKGELNVVQRI